MIRKKALIASTAILTALAMCLPTFAAVTSEIRHEEIQMDNYFGGYIGQNDTAGNYSGYQVNVQASTTDEEMTDASNYASEQSFADAINNASWQHVTATPTILTNGSMIYSGSGGVDVGIDSSEFNLTGATQTAHVLIRQDVKQNATVSSSDFKKCYPSNQYNVCWVLDPEINDAPISADQITVPINNGTIGYTRIGFSVPVMPLQKIDFYLIGLAYVSGYNYGLRFMFPNGFGNFFNNADTKISCYTYDSGEFILQREYDQTNKPSTNSYGGYNIYNSPGKVVLYHFTLVYEPQMNLTSGTTLFFEFADDHNYKNGFTASNNPLGFYGAESYCNIKLITQNSILSSYLPSNFTDSSGNRYSDYIFNVTEPNSAYQIRAEINIPCSAESGTELKISDFKFEFYICEILWGANPELDPVETDPPGGGDDPSGPSGPGFTDDTRRVEGMDDVIGGYDDIYKPDIDISGQDVPGYSGSDLSGAVGLAAALGKYSKSVFVIPKIGIGLGISIAAIFIKHILKTSAD